MSLPTWRLKNRNHRASSATSLVLSISLVLSVAAFDAAWTYSALRTVPLSTFTSLCMYFRGSTRVRYLR